MATIKCPRCGEEYSTTYRRCPFCADRSQSNRPGRREINNTRGGGYGGARPRQGVYFGRIFIALLSIVVIIAAICIVVGAIRGIVHHSREHRDQLPDNVIEQDDGTLLPGFALSTEELTFSAPGQQSTVTLIYNEGEEPMDVIWTSSRPSVATVDENGLVTAVSEGTSTVTATSGDITRACIVNCVFSGDGFVAEQPVIAAGPLSVTTAYGNSAADMSIAVGESVATVITGGDGSYVWTSDNPAVASVGTDGVITGVAAGAATVTCTSGDQAFVCTVRVH